jgi:hypothetical protein
MTFSVVVGARTCVGAGGWPAGASSRGRCGRAMVKGIKMISSVGLPGGRRK